MGSIIVCCGQFSFGLVGPNTAIEDGSKLYVFFLSQYPEHLIVPAYSNAMQDPDSFRRSQKGSPQDDRSE
jgi:hypothetical protein